jgi:hypothetical protein
VFGDLCLDLCGARERIVPARFQFPCHETVGRVGGIILAKGSIGSVACGLKIPHQRFTDLIAPVRDFSLGRDSCSNRSRLNDLEERRFDCVIDAQSAKGNATRLAVIESTSMTGIARDCVLRAGIADGQLTAAAAAANEAGEQRITMLGRAMMPARWNVLAHHSADRLRTLPIHVALMAARLQRQPFRAQLAPPVNVPTRATTARCSAGLTIGVGTTVDGVADDAVDGSVAGPAPDDIAVAPFRRQNQPMFMQPQKRLSRAAEFFHFVEDQGDGFLNAPVGVLKQILVSGQRARICATMRAISSTAPAEASMLERRSLAASRCRSQKM